MIRYQTIQLKDRTLFERHYQTDPKRTCEHCFANNYLWQNVYPTEVAEFDGCLSVRFWDGDIQYYDFPSGVGDQKAAFARILEMEKDRKPQFYGLLRDEVALIEQWYPGEFHIQEERDLFDYIYETERLTSLSGKKLHGKRNHINRFKENANWNYEALGKKNYEECIAMNQVWKEKREDKWDEEMEEEFQVVNYALQVFDQIGMVGGVLRLDGRVIAFTMGEPLGGDTFAVHFEKAFPEIQGAYPMINQQFALHACQKYRYINREDDAGQEGLRRAKLSYGPDILLEKYIVTKA